MNSQLGQQVAALRRDEHTQQLAVIDHVAMATQQLKQAIQTEFRRQQLVLDKEALTLVIDYVTQAAQGLEPLYALIDRLDTGALNSQVGTRRCVGGQKPPELQFL